MSVRTALGIFCVSALAAGTLAPATAQAKGHDDSDQVKVRVCKYVRGDDEDSWYRFRAWTDEDSNRFALQDDDCKYYRYDYDDNFFYLKERNSEDYNVSFRVWGDYDWYRYNDEGRLRVKFDDNDPYLTIAVYNRKHHHHHD